jgi:uncharacterized protein YcfJ
MPSRVLPVSVVMGSMILAQAALADPYHDKGPARAYGPGPEFDYARVVDVDPVMRRVRIETPQRECWNEDRYEEPPPPNVHAGLAGPMILGGLLGGAIGNQFGHGDGRRAATVAGVLIGSSLAHDYGARRQAERAAYASSEPRVYSVERCQVRYTDTYEERIEGYDVEYEYNGRRYHTRLPYDPGERIRIRVDVQPAEG